MSWLRKAPGPLHDFSLKTMCGSSAHITAQSKNTPLTLGSSPPTYKSTYQISTDIPISSASKIQSLLLISIVPLEVSTKPSHLCWDQILLWWTMISDWRNAIGFTYAWSVLQGQYNSPLMGDTWQHCRRQERKKRMKLTFVAQTLHVTNKCLISTS